MSGRCGSADSKATLVTSRRNFIAGAKLLGGAGLAFALGLAGKSSPADAMGSHSRYYSVYPGGGYAPVPPDGDLGSSSLGNSFSPPSSPSSPSKNPACFLPGALIETPGGRVPVEWLRIGDEVSTFSGEAKLIKWIARREIKRSASRHWNQDAGPVKIVRFAIDGKAPQRELYLSPGHAIYIDGMLIPVRNLINGTTIVADARPDEMTLTYYHIEFDTHEAILAEGLPVESFGGDNRDAFDNADEYLKLYGSLGEPLVPFAPIASYHGGRQELASHIRSALAPIRDYRKPLDKVRDRIADQAVLARAA